MSPVSPDLPARALAVLRAVAAGRAEMTCSCEPDLFIDGLACCDQAIARLLAHAELICPARPGALGQRVPVRLTAAGHTVLRPEPLEAA
ncbi:MULTISPECIES: hypothetical protein [Amycolatopsis]|uniref:Uncharacterized protein n=2 Tax=Amycolatopsis TaxID=1813 RepID=A0A1I3V0E2_9PSEU|nr:hypothetical protein [Amycolatopsis sacchari]SFJ88705.1 hypothetical protein SAMN05421835_11071 [Amycolatopsis sacchari]